jgi:DNA polymerase-3 subunit chi
VDIAFYHVTRGPVEAVLPRLLERAFASGLRVALRVPDPARRAALDQHLWTYDALSFLPHAAEPCDSAADQPILLTATHTAANDAQMLIALEPPLPRDGFARAALIFADADAAPARAEWKALKADGIAATYWKQTASGWEKAG